MSFKSVMQKIGEEFKTGLTEVKKYLPEAATLAGLIFPGETGTIAGVVSSVNLIQNAVVTIEQKYAASGAATATGASKAADVLTFVGPTVLTELQAAGVKDIDTTTVQNIVNAVVAIMNAQQAPA